MGARRCGYGCGLRLGVGEAGGGGGERLHDFVGVLHDSFRSQGVDNCLGGGVHQWKSLYTSQCLGRGSGNSVHLCLCR